MTDWAAFAGFTGLVLAVLLSLAHFSRGVPHAEGTGSDALDAPAAPGDGASDSDSRATAADDSVPTAAESDETDWSAELDTVSLASFSVDSTGAQGRLGIIVTGLLGFVLAAAFVLTESLLVVVVAHYLVNALEFAGHELFGW